MSRLIIDDPLAVSIADLNAIGQCDVRITFSRSELQETALQLAEHLRLYIENEGHIISAGEKLSWASSVLRFDRVGDTLQAHALNVQLDVFEQNADRVLSAWREQLDLCSRVSSPYISTNLTDLVAVSPDVENGGDVKEGVRYEPNLQNSGWWFFGLAYEGDLGTIRPVHVGDVVRNCPAIVKFLALAPGFCFSCKPEQVWYEKEVAADSR